LCHQAHGFPFSRSIRSAPHRLSMPSTCARKGFGCMMEQLQFVSRETLSKSNSLLLCPPSPAGAGFFSSVPRIHQPLVMIGELRYLRKQEKSSIFVAYIHLFGHAPLFPRIRNRGEQRSLPFSGASPPFLAPESCEWLDELAPYEILL